MRVVYKCNKQNPSFQLFPPLATRNARIPSSIGKFLQHGEKRKNFRFAHNICAGWQIFIHQHDSHTIYFALESSEIWKQKSSSALKENSRAEYNHSLAWWKVEKISVDTRNFWTQKQKKFHSFWQYSFLRLSFFCRAQYSQKKILKPETTKEVHNIVQYSSAWWKLENKFRFTHNIHNTHIYREFLKPETTEVHNIGQGETFIHQHDGYLDKYLDSHTTFAQENSETRNRRKWQHNNIWHENFTWFGKLCMCPLRKS